MKSIKDSMVSSVYLTSEINSFRRKHLEATDNEYKELKHKDFMKKIRSVLKVLKTSNTKWEDSILESSYIDSKGERRPCFSLNKNGVKHIVDLTRSRDKMPLQKIYENMGGPNSSVICVERFETSFINKLSDTLAVIDIILETQKNVLNYRIDGYIDRLNLAIEYDEAHHFVEPNKTKDLRRQFEVENKIGCRFIRLDYRDTDAHNIGLVIREIFDMTFVEWKERRLAIK